MLRRYGWTAAVRNYVARVRADDRRRGRRPLLGWEPLEDRTNPNTYTVTNTNDSGAGSFRQAILDANAATGADTIRFNIAGDLGEVHTIRPSYIGGGVSLPVITDPVTVDGWSQGGSGYVGPPLVELDGTYATDGSLGSFGLNVQADNVTVRGLTINRYPNVAGNGFGIGVFATASNVWIYGNYLGTDATGAGAAGNGQGGIWIGPAATAVTVGTNADGTNDAAERNVISGNGGNGVLVQGASNVIAGNSIGTNAAGTAALGNAAAGVLIQGGASGNVVGTNGDGSADAAEGNLISGNSQYGVLISGANNNRVAGNFIGTDATGRLAVPNPDAVAIFGATGNVIGTDGSDDPFNANERNVIAGNTGRGIVLSGANVAAGNWIGVDIDGAALGNDYGIQVTEAGGRVGTNADGVADAAERNVISGNTLDGIIIRNVGTTGAVVAGNYIGTDPTGLLARPNHVGIEIILGAYGNTVGGLTAAPGAGAGNLIAGNATTGLYIEGVGTDGNTVQGNLFGLDRTGTVYLPNNFGEWIYNGPRNTLFGGTAAGARNVFASGIQISGGTPTPATDNRVEGNYIGTDAAGTTALVDYAVLLNFTLGTAAVNTIGGTAPGAGNLIGGTAAGIGMSDAAGFVVQGNTIGLNAAGTAGLAGAGAGVELIFDSTGNLIGGTAPGAGNVISGNGGDGVRLTLGSAGNTVQGNLIGTDAAGAAAVPNGASGVVISDGATGNTVGGTAPGAGNVLSGNAHRGVWIIGAGTADNLVAGNVIGLNAAGTAAVGNGFSGVRVDGGAADNTIGGAAAGARNVISGNGKHGVVATGGAARTAILGNYIGTDATGTAALGNTNSGVFVGGATDTRVGGTAPGAGNLLSGNGTHGVRLGGAEGAASGTRIEGNRIGTNAAGTAALPNDNSGVVISNGASGTTVGGPDPAAANTISGNGTFGVHLLIDDEAPPPADNLIAGNRIGTDVSGLLPLGNASDGIRIGFGVENTTIGRPAADDADPLGTYGNVIAANGGRGVSVGDYTSGTAIRGNFIGTDRTRAAALGNAADGVSIDTADVVVGGVADPAEGNVIAHNLGAGVLVVDQGISADGGPRDGNRVRGNAIYRNVGLGIDLGTDLGADGVTPNDPGDLDDGPNARLNFPVLTGAVVADGQLLVSGVARPGDVLDVYAADLTRFGADADDPNGFGQGRAYLGTVAVPAGTAAGYGPKAVNGAEVGSDAATAFTLALPLPAGFALGTPVVATASTPAGTSEFGNNVPVGAAALTLVLDPPAVDEGGTTVLRGAFPVVDPTHAHTVRIDWGDGASEARPVPAGEAAFAVPHRYLDDPAGDGTNFPVSVTVTDDVTGTVQAATAGVAVANVAPRVKVVSAPGASADASRVVLAAAVTDPGPLDTFTYRWVATVNGRVVGAADGPTFTFDRSTAGVSVVTLTVTDDDGGFGTDTAAVVSLTPGDDAVTLAPGDVPAGVDRLVVFALAGNDAVNASALTVPVEVVGGDGNDTVTGGFGNDLLAGGMGNDSIAGGDGDDVIEEGPGSADTIAGGAGNDTLSFKTSSAGVTFSLARADAQPVFADGGGTHYVTASGVENVAGSDFADDLSGGDGDNAIFGGTGRDTIRGGGGNDVIYGGTGTGSDTVGGGAGDVIYGGTGRDTINGAGGNDLIYGGTGTSSDTVGGGAGDVIYGGVGSDTIRGSGTDDVIYGGTGTSSDTVAGGGDDLIFGGAG
ncbi:MAG: hypothetical protein K2X87_12355, partial [Gemmataceae bacterium]|nr:hypothetical protein [Gemmataceae bacterium]